MQKIRNVPHQEGNYQTFISIDVLHSLKYENIKSDIINTIAITNQNNKIEEINRNEMHISLIKTTKYLKHFEIKNFISSIKSEMALISPFSLGVTNKVKFFANEFSNRFFISLLVFRTKQLAKLCDIINKALIKFGLDEDTEFIPHLSLLWSLQGDYGILEEELNHKINNDHPKVIKVIKVEKISLLIGKNKTILYLSK